MTLNEGALVLTESPLTGEDPTDGIITIIKQAPVANVQFSLSPAKAATASRNFKRSEFQFSDASGVQGAARDFDILLYHRASIIPASDDADNSDDDIVTGRHDTQKLAWVWKARSSRSLKRVPSEGKSAFITF